MIQEFCSSGEEKGAALYLLEQTDQQNRSWMSAVYDASGVAGIFFASVLASYFGAEYWRYLFWFGSIAASAGIWLRNHAQESPGFTSAKIEKKLLWIERSALLKIMCVSGFSYANYYMVSVFLNGFLPKISKITAVEALQFNSHLLWIDAVLLLGIGMLCRWISKEKIMSVGALSAALLAIPLFLLLPESSKCQAAMVRIVLAVCSIALAAPFHAWAMEIAPIKHRFLIGNVGAALGAKCFGAPMPALATFLVMQTGWIGAAAMPIVITGFLAFLAIRGSCKTQEAEVCSR